MFPAVYSSHWNGLGYRHLLGLQVSNFFHYSFTQGLIPTSYSVNTGHSRAREAEVLPGQLLPEY